jgi:hypothetical protein
MNHAGILLKDFSGWVDGLTARIRDSAEQRAKDLGIEVRYLTRGGVDKESLAREIAQARGITQGSICLLSVVEPCIAPMVKGNKAAGKLEVVMAPRKCVWLYHYFDDPVLGFGHVRLQSWVPFNVFNHTRDFKVFRPPADDADRPASWQRMRKGVSDLHRRCELSDQCNERYGEAMASVEVQEKLKEVVTPACNRIRKDGKSYRGLNPWQEQDYQLLRFLAQGHQALNGFRNKDLRRWLYPKSDEADPQTRRREAGRTTRCIKLLRAHGLVRKVAKENRYTLTAQGQKFASALLSASAVDIKGLTKLAA